MAIPKASARGGNRTHNFFVYSESSLPDVDLTTFRCRTRAAKSSLPFDYPGKNRGQVSRRQSCTGIEPAPPTVEGGCAPIHQTPKINFASGGCDVVPSAFLSGPGWIRTTNCRETPNLQSGEQPIAQLTPKCAGTELNRHSLNGGWVTATWTLQCPADAFRGRAGTPRPVCELNFKSLVMVTPAVLVPGRPTLVLC